MNSRVYEPVGGAIVVTPAGMGQSEVAARITVALGSFVFPDGIGAVLTEGMGIELPAGNVRSPDVGFVGSAKLPGGRSLPRTSEPSSQTSFHLPEVSLLSTSGRRVTRANEPGYTAVFLFPRTARLTSWMASACGSDFA